MYINYTTLNLLSPLNLTTGIRNFGNLVSKLYNLIDEPAFVLKFHLSRSMERTYLFLPTGFTLWHKGCNSDGKRSKTLLKLKN
jgi:hypothetical protein